MTYETAVYYFYKCANETYAEGCDYFDHTHGVAGFKQLQPGRSRFIGHMTVQSLHDLRHPKHLNNAYGVHGRRAGYTNVTKTYSERY